MKMKRFFFYECKMDQSEKERESKCCCSSLIKSEMSSRCERKTVRCSIDMRTLDLFDIECCKLADIFSGLESERHCLRGWEVASALFLKELG